MSQLNLREIHKYEKVPGKTNVVRLVKTSPAMRLGTEEGCYFIQHGKVFSAGGVEVPAKDLPGWFNDLVAKADPDALAECGWRPVAPKPNKG